MTQLSETERILLEYQSLQTQLLLSISVQNHGHLNNFATILLNLEKLMAAVGTDLQWRRDLLQNVDVVIESADRISEFNSKVEIIINSLKESTNALLGNEDSSSKFGTSLN